MEETEAGRVEGATVAVAMVGATEEVEMAVDSVAVTAAEETEEGATEEATEAEATEAEARAAEATEGVATVAALAALRAPRRQSSSRVDARLRRADWSTGDTGSRLLQCRCLWQGCRRCSACLRSHPARCTKSRRRLSEARTPRCLTPRRSRRSLGVVASPDCRR